MRTIELSDYDHDAEIHANIVRFLLWLDEQDKLSLVRGFKKEAWILTTYWYILLTQYKVMIYRLLSGKINWQFEGIGYSFEGLTKKLLTTNYLNKGL